MNCPRTSSAFFLLLLVQTAWTQDKAAQPEKPASPWAIDRALTVSPQAADAETLKYRLLPISSELKEGNAVPIYLRLIHEQNDAARKYWTETPKAWNELPIDKIPQEDAKKFLQNMKGFIQQFEFGARRRTAEWNYTFDAGDPIGLLLPDIQNMRNYLPMMILQARVAMAQGDFTAAVHHLQTAFAFSRHVAQAPTLIHGLVGFACATQIAYATADCIERPGAPNLYWALTALPRPLIDLRGAFEWEYGLAQWQFPDLADLDRVRTPEQWDAVLRHLRTEMRTMASTIGEGAQPGKLPVWYPQHYAPEDSAAKSRDLPAARKYVARTKGISLEQAESLPAAQVLLMYFLATFHQDRDEVFRVVYLPFPQAIPLTIASRKRLEETPATEGQVMARLLLPALNKVLPVQNRLERNLAALRVVEALRMYAASHDGQLPEKLSDVTEVPIPNDPGSDKPFEYKRQGGVGVIISQSPADLVPSNGIRYRVTIRKN